MRLEPVTLLLWTEPEPVTKVKARLTADNAIIITCQKQKVYGEKEIFELTWENDGKVENKTTGCSFERKDLLYLTNYTFKVSRLIKLNI